MKWNVSDWLLLIYDIVTAIAAFVAYRALRVIREQGRAMREQLQEMKASGEQAKALIIEAGKQAAQLAHVATATQQSADAAKKSAAAALLNAQALINSERPWIFVRYDISQLNIAPVPGVQEFVPNSISFVLTNSGRTPAEVLYFYGNYTICPAREVDDVKMPERELQGEFMHKKIFSPADSLGFFDFVPSTSISDDDLRAIASSRMRLVFWGIVKYRDTLGGAEAPIRETWYCYWYSPRARSLVMCGPSGANKHT
jgi:hypothetical protein